MDPNTPTPGLRASDAVAATEPGLDDALFDVWQENRKLILGGLFLALALMIGWAAWKYLAAQNERKVQEEFAQATSADQWKRFASAHAGHALAGVAQLRIGDDAYQAGRYAEAETAYQAAVSALPDGPFKPRARLGGAMAQIAAGKVAEGEATLKQIAEDTSLIKDLRAEAAYHLTSLAAAANRPADVAKYADMVMQVDLDPSGPWLSRALTLKMKQAGPGGGLTPAAPSGPASLLTQPAPNADAGAGLKLTVPTGK